MSITIGTAITATSYGSILSTVTSVLSTYYGFPQASLAVLPGSRIKADDWRNLYEDINHAVKHQTDAFMPFGNISTGSILTSQFINSLTNYSTQISTNRAVVSLNQLVRDSTHSTSTRATTWGSDITHEVQYTWNSAADAEAFFNQGGYLFPNLKIIANAFGSPENIAWSSIISNTMQDIINQPLSYTYNRTRYIGSFVTFSYQAYPYTIDFSYIKVNAYTIKARVIFNTHSQPALNIDVLPEATFYNYYSTGATGGVSAPRPSILVTTSLDMGGETLYPRLTYAPTTSTSVNQYDTITKTVTVVNTGTAACTISNFGFIAQAGSGIYASSITVNTTTVAINGSATLTLEINADAGVQGTYTDSYVEVFSDSITGTVRIPMKIIVSEPVFRVSLTPATVTATNTVTTIAPVIQHFTFGAGLTGKIYSYTASITNPQYFSVTARSANINTTSLTPDNAIFRDLLSTTFTPPRVNTVGDTVGVYTATLTVTFSPIDFHQSAKTYTVPIRYNVNIANHNIGFWLSPKDNDNCVMACSYDFVGGERFLTIGFGMGGDGTEPYLADKEEDITETRTSSDSEGNTTSETVVVGKKKYKGSAVYVSTATVGILGDPDRHLGIPLYLSARTDFCPFLQQYGSWITPDGGHGYNSSFDLSYKFSVPVAGAFTYEFSAVGSSSLLINGTQVATWGNYGSSTAGTVNLSAGEHTVRIVTGSTGTGATDGDGIVLRDSFGSFGVNIKDSNGNSWWSTKTPRRTAYKYWAEVYRFPISMNSGRQELYSKNYAVKLTDLALGKTYGGWCGQKNDDPTKDTLGSMFVVLNDGKGNLVVSMNPWPGKETTGSYSLNRTLGYAVALPYYYSTLNNRVTNLANPFKKFKTSFFVGFYNTGKLRLTEQPFPYVYTEDGVSKSGGGGSDGKRTFWANLIIAAAVAGVVYAGLALASIAVVAVLGYTITAVALSAGVGVLAFLALAACFTGDTLVSMADGTFKMIKDMQVGDLVFNHDKTRVNRVTYIEQTLDTQYGHLYSITKDQEPFITINHPMYIDGKLSSVYPKKIYESYPWLGLTETLIPDRIVEATGQTVYNLWTDGDHTYIVNGYGTTTINGDGGWGRLLVEQGITTPERLGEVLFECASGGKQLSYGAHICDRILAKLNIKIVNKVVGKIMDRKDSPLPRRAILKLFKAVGHIAVYITERKKRK